VSEPQVEGPLAAVEADGRWLVVRAADPDDWLVAFAPDGGFPARAWAENMVAVYNARLGRLNPASSRRPPAASGR
jgi:hypothetical protein